ncbi:MAG: M64 family metallopeptidase, partial [Bacteroidota bacterium]
EPWNPNLTTLTDFDSKWKSMMDPKTPVPTPPGERFNQKVGVFEGGGYVSKGVFRPMTDCRMHSNEASFCPVCTDAIERMILSHTGL